MRALAVGFLLLAAACGKTTNLVDGATGDGKGADAASTADADAHGVVTVLVLDQQGSGTPVANQPVVFVEPDGTVEPVQATGSDGKASYSVLPGASVVTVYGAIPNLLAEMVRGAKPGDLITIGSKTAGAPAGTFGVTITPVVLSQSYDIYGPCGSVNVPDPGSGATTASGTLTMSSTCQQATMDLVAVLRNGSGTPASYVEQNNVAFTDGGSATMPSTWIPLQQNTTTYSNLPAGNNNAGFELHVPDASGYAATRYVGAGGTGSTMYTSSPVAAHALEVTSISGDNGTQIAYQQIDGTPATYTVDYSTGLLPYLGKPALDVTTGAVTSTVTGTGTGDVYNIQLEYNRPDASVAGLDYIDWDIWMAAPGDVTLPTLPTAGLADVNARAGDSVDYQYAALYDADAITSYDQIRAHLFDAFAAYYAGRGTTGVLRVSTSDTTGAALAGRGQRAAVRRSPSLMPHPPVAAHRSR